MGDWLSRTMLIERVSAMVVYVLILAIIYKRIRRAKNYKTIKNALNAYIILLCILAFFYIPPVTADLYRWRAIMTVYEWAKKSFVDFFEDYLVRINTPVAYLYMYLFNLTGIDGLLPAFCALVFYGNAFYILKDLYRRHEVPANNIALTLFFIMAGGSFLEVISGVRCFVSLSILARCFYDEFYNNKPIIKNIIWEALAALTHSMAAIFLIGRLLFTVLQKNHRRSEKALNIIFAAGIAAIVLYFGSGYISSGLRKAEYYLTNENAYSYFWEYVIGAVVVLQFVIVLWRVYKQHSGRSMSVGKQNLIIFNTIIIAAEVILCFEYNIFHRSVLFSTLTMSPLVAETMTSSRKKGLGQTMWWISLLVLFLACTRGNLCGYKFMLLQ